MIDNTVHIQLTVFVFPPFGATESLRFANQGFAQKRVGVMRYVSVPRPYML